MKAIHLTKVLRLLMQTAAKMLHNGNKNGLQRLKIIYIYIYIQKIIYIYLCVYIYIYTVGQKSI